MPPRAPRPESFTGIGLRAPHAAALLAHGADLGFVEVHSENFFGDDAAARQGLLAVRERWDISLHGVGLSLGAAAGVDAWHLERLARLVDEVQPVSVSDHAAFARARPDGHSTVHAADLLPLAFTPRALDILVANIGQVQERLQRRIAIENLSAYIAFEDDEIPEVEFLIEACRRSGCGLLLDLNNLVVNGVNRYRLRHGAEAHGFMGQQAALQQAQAEAMDFVWSLPPGIVRQIHLAGFRWPATPEAWVIDDHSQRVSPTVWSVYEAALDHLGPCATLIEWDTDLPPLAVLLDEARLAAQRLGALMGPEHGGQADLDDGDGDGL
jgi:uncharacterized protein (UPF0276 family)